MFANFVIIIHLGNVGRNNLLRLSHLYNIPTSLPNLRCMCIGDWRLPQLALLHVALLPIRHSLRWGVWYNKRGLTQFLPVSKNFDSRIGDNRSNVKKWASHLIKLVSEVLFNVTYLVL